MKNKYSGLMNERMNDERHPSTKIKSAIGCQTNGIYIKKLKSNMYILIIHTVIKTV